METDPSWIANENIKCNGHCTEQSEQFLEKLRLRYDPRYVTKRTEKKFKQIEDP